MKDNLEKFIAGNRKRFDNKSPREGVWSRISDSLFQGNAGSFWNSVSIWRAAAIVLMGFSGYLYFSRPGVIGRVPRMALQQDFTDIESFYSAQISEKIALISNEDLFADNSFTQDIQKLEAMYTVLAEDMKKHPSEKVKDALVLNMLVRIDLLNQQLQKLEDVKKKAKIESAIL